MQKLIIAGIGGFIGSACRYWLSLATYRVLGQDFPYGTLVVNVMGSLLIGFLMALFEERFVISANFRIFLTIGILGGFTTFSTFSYETVELLREGSYQTGMINILSTVFICLGATWLGSVIGKLI
ncbi:fluoride efflux transporter CrcB [bacterium]|nr:fluoride efflux transporter CrcB [bacterium]MCI0604010.1 fluoride efflux transporter CrcB [bacterium]